MRFKVGDRVKIKSLDWYNKNKDNNGTVYTGNSFWFWKNMSRYCGEIMKITFVKVYLEDSNKGYYVMENCNGRWTDEMIEGLVEEEFITTNGLQLNQSNTSLKKEMEWNLPQGYQFKDENGNVINATKIVLEKLKKEYPTTYEECCEVLGLEDDEIYINVNITNIETLENKKFATFIRLIRCRNAYWKIAGEEMELGKPWKPDWKDGEQKKYCIYNYMDNIRKDSWFFCNAILAFPTKEMRDDFSKHFKKDIEQCKELL